MGNVSPVGWRAASNFLLHVTDSGEQADMLVMNNLPDQKTPADLRAELQNATPDEIRAIGSLATIDHENKTIFVATAVSPNRLAIGGLVLHADAEELALLRSLFQESPVRMSPEA